MDYCAAKGWIIISDRFAISTWLTLCLCPCWCADRRCSCIVCTRILLCVWFVRVYPFGHHNSKVHLAKKPRNTPAESADTTERALYSKFCEREKRSETSVWWSGLRFARLAFSCIFFVCGRAMANLQSPAFARARYICIHNSRGLRFIRSYLLIYCCSEKRIRFMQNSISAVCVQRPKSWCFAIFRQWGAPPIS